MTKVVDSAVKPTALENTAGSFQLDTEEIINSQCLLRGGYNRELQKFLESVFEVFLNEEERQTTLKLISEHDVSFTDIHAGTFKEAYNQEMLFFRENKIYEGVLNKIKLPACPHDTGKFPPMIIDVEGGHVVIEGNHRVYKALHIEVEGENILFAIRFSCPQAYQELFGFKLIKNYSEYPYNGWGEPNPSLTYENRPKKLQSAW